MKQLLVAASLVAVLGTACKQKNSEAQVLGAYKDSVEMAQFNQWKLQKSIDSAKAVDSARDAAIAAEAARVAAANQPRTRTVYVRDNSGSSTASSSSSSARPKGWSKAAKGAVIGGAGGALVGGVVSKNKALGAVIGGVAGAGTGYAIGRGEDKKDGRVKPRQ